jgi:hypothetical protein
MTGAIQEGAKVANTALEIMRAQPLVLMMGLMNAGLLVFLWLYMSRITARTETTAQALFGAQDKLFAQWGTIVKDTNDLAEKSLHCVTVDDALKLIRPLVPQLPGTTPNRYRDIELPLPPLKLLMPQVPSSAEKE